MPTKIKTWRNFQFGRKVVGSARPSEASQAKDRIGRKVYDSRNWQRLRRLQLAAFPLCAVCGDVGEQVDHVMPIVEGGAAFDQANLQTLCASCHSQKTRKENQVSQKNVKSSGG